MELVLGDLCGGVGWESGVIRGCLMGGKIGECMEEGIEDVRGESIEEGWGLVGIVRYQTDQ